MKNFIAKQIHSTAVEIWEDVIELAFVSADGQYISLTRIPDEDHIYVEFGEQIHFLYSKVASYSLDERSVSFVFKSYKSSALAETDFQIEFDTGLDLPSNLRAILAALFKGIDPA